MLWSDKSKAEVVDLNICTGRQERDTTVSFYPDFRF